MTALLAGRSCELRRKEEDIDLRSSRCLEKRPLGATGLGGLMLKGLLRSAMLWCSVFAAFVAFQSVVGADVLKDYNKTIAQAGFEPVYPAVSGVKPGYLYTERKGGDGKLIQTPLCGATFSTPSDAPADLSLASVKAKNTKELSLGLGLDPAVLKGKGDVSAVLKNAGVSDGSLVFGASQKNSIPSLVSANGTAREVLQACQTTIKPYFRNQW